MIFNFELKSHFEVQSAFYGMDFISVILTEMKFQTGMRFSCQHLPEAKWISADSLDIAFNAHVHLKLIAVVILTEKKIHFGWLNIM